MGRCFGDEVCATEMFLRGRQHADVKSITGTVLPPEGPGARTLRALRQCSKLKPSARRPRRFVATRADRSQDHHDGFRLHLPAVADGTTKALTPADPLAM